MPYICLLLNISRGNRKKKLCKNYFRHPLFFGILETKFLIIQGYLLFFSLKIPLLIRLKVQFILHLNIWISKKFIITNK